MGRAFIIGIAGGTGSGKTTVARRIAEIFRVEEVLLLDQDAYYKDLSHLSFEERKRVNFDHPDAFDTDLLVEHLRALRKRLPIQKPVYSYKEHRRKEETVRISPAHIILLEGILVLEMEPLRELMDMKIFVDTDDDIRLIRRLTRDIKERGRDLEQSIIQYEQTVRPMHLAFVVPSKRYADVVIPHGGENRVAIQMIEATLRERLRQVDNEEPQL
ncbi:uridine kinase [Myxococcota bacterium]|jgi:uridine kinase|nr:uridine kinase [Myxococcota bacterium]